MTKSSHQSMSDSSISMLENRLAEIHHQIEVLKKEEKALNRALQTLKAMPGKEAGKKEPRERNKGISEKVEKILEKYTQISVDEICSICLNDLKLVNPDGLRGSVQTFLSKMRQKGEVEVSPDKKWKKKVKGVFASS